MRSLGKGKKEEGMGDRGEGGCLFCSKAGVEAGTALSLLVPRLLNQESTSVATQGFSLDFFYRVGKARSSQS